MSLTSKVIPGSLSLHDGRSGIIPIFTLHEDIHATCVVTPAEELVLVSCHARENIRGRIWIGILSKINLKELTLKTRLIWVINSLTVHLNLVSYYIIPNWSWQWLISQLLAMQIHWSLRNPFLVWHCIDCIRYLNVKFKFDIVHCNTTNTLVNGSKLARILLRTLRRTISSWNPVHKWASVINWGWKSQKERRLRNEQEELTCNCTRAMRQNRGQYFPIWPKSWQKDP